MQYDIISDIYAATMNDVVESYHVVVAQKEVATKLRSPW
jgi:hypothetical protein